MILKIGIILCTFIAMEAVAWLTHKYVMHGFGWYLHADHHEPHKKKTEKNDLFFLIFAIPSSSCIMLGFLNDNLLSTYIGFGILVYGIAYLIIHDIFIHQRIKWLKKADHPYFRAIRYAHKIHHKHLGKQDGECFGMLFVPFKYYRKAKQEKLLK